uniref:(northern house mosquito) hypothetical protein n=1 Tax=Culex pipiens TaxID=7175 RepID=A0A8D8DY29_CULPI
MCRCQAADHVGQFIFGDRKSRDEIGRRNSRQHEEEYEIDGGRAAGFHPGNPRRKQLPDDPDATARGERQLPAIAVSYAGSTGDHQTTGATSVERTAWHSAHEAVPGGRYGHHQRGEPLERLLHQPPGPVRDDRGPWPRGFLRKLPEKGAGV